MRRLIVQLESAGWRHLLGSGFLAGRNSLSQTMVQSPEKISRKLHENFLPILINKNSTLKITIKIHMPILIKLDYKNLEAIRLFNNLLTLRYTLKNAPNKG